MCQSTKHNPMIQFKKYSPGFREMSQHQGPEECYHWRSDLVNGGEIGEIHDKYFLLITDFETSLWRWGEDNNDKEQPSHSLVLHLLSLVSADCSLKTAHLLSLVSAERSLMNGALTLTSSLPDASSLTDYKWSQSPWRGHHQGRIFFQK